MTRILRYGETYDDNDTEGFLDPDEWELEPRPVYPICEHLAGAVASLNAHGIIPSACSCCDGVHMLCTVCDVDYQNAGALFPIA